MPPTIFISAGEASGEHYGALLVAALKRHLALLGESAEFVGMGGERMVAAGLERVVRSEDMAVMGITEVIRHLPRIYGEFRKLKDSIRARRPDVAVLIDFPDIHFRLAEEFHRLGVPVVFFVSPQLWAWKKHRIKLVQKYIRKMLVIFPFEEQFYKDHGVEAEFVGHPLAELPLPAITREQFAAENGLDAARTWIGLLPGSRPKEIRDNLPEMLRAARGMAQGVADGPLLTEILQGHPSGAKAQLSGGAFSARLKSCPDASCPPLGVSPQPIKPEPFSTGGLEFLVPLAPTLTAEQRAEVLALVEREGSGLAIRLVEDARAALFHARASIVASGTATVEAALIGNPFAVVYRVSPLTYAIAKRLVKVPHVAMANLIAGKRMVPELIQDDFTAENIVQQVELLLPDGAARESMIEELKTVRRLLQPRQGGDEAEGDGAIERVASVTLEVMQGLSPVRVEKSVPI
jgi:lipid-A-disaccharide synthase